MTTVNEDEMFDTAAEWTTTEQLARTLAGKDPREVFTACGLILRAVVEELMERPDDDDEREKHTKLAIAHVIATIDHPSITRKKRSS